MGSDPTLLTTPDGTTWRAPSLASADRERVRWGGFPEFVRLAMPRVPLVVDYQWEWCQDEMARHAEGLFWGAKGCTELVTNVPPGVGKSDILTVLYPAWIWTQDISHQIMSASFDVSLARKHSGWTLEIMKSRWFKERWGDLLLTDSNQAEYHMRDRKGRKGGYRFATSVGSRGVGRHGHLYIIDDPLKVKDVQQGGRDASTALEAAWDWIQSSVISRAAKDVQKVSLVMQRLHEADPSGHMVNSFGPLGGLAHLMLPYKFERARRCVTRFGGDRRTEEGSLIVPFKGAEVKYRRTVAAQGGAQGIVIQSQYQQNPTPDGGIIFDPKTFQLFDPADPALAWRGMLTILSVDATFGKKHSSADYVAIEAWGYSGGRFYCFDSNIEKRTFPETVQAIRDMAALWPPSDMILIEDAANGPAIVQTLSTSMPNVIGVGVAGESKDARARAVSHMFTAGRVAFARGAPWLERKLSNLAHFPNAAHDDDVDATTQAINWMRAEYLGDDGGAFDVAVDEWAAEREAAQAQPFGLAGAVDRARAEAVPWGVRPV